jgi:hypothetical protein
MIALFAIPATVSLILNIAYLWEHDWGWKLVNPYPTSDSYLYLYSAWFKAFIDPDGGFIGKVIPFSLHIELLTFFYQLFGAKIWVPYLATVPFTVLTAGLVGLLGFSLSNYRIGMIAGCLFACTGLFIFFSGLTYKTSLVIFLSTLAVYLSVRKINNHK